MKGDPVGEFVRSFADGCKNTAALKNKLSGSAGTVKGLDGRPMNPLEFANFKRLIEAMDNACRRPNKDTVRQFIELTTDQQIATCTVLNDYSDMTFSWNQATQSWISQEGPTGPCGSISIETLEPDPNNKQFWRYTQKKIRTRPDGVLDNGLSCKQFPDVTLNYTWRAATNATGCTYIKNLMN